MEMEAARTADHCTLVKMRPSAVAAIIVLLGLPVFAASSDIDLFLPIVGRGHQLGGRVFDTTLWITNPGDATAHVTLFFLHAAQPNPLPRHIEFSIAAGATRVFDPIGAEILGAPEGVGALRIRSDRALVASVRTSSRIESESASRAVATTFDAVPARFAIGNGQTSIAQGVMLSPNAAERYRVYVVETAGQSLTYVIAVVDANGKTLTQKSFYVAPGDERVIDLGDEFPNIRVDHAVARVRGVNGTGRIIFAGARIARESQDSSSFEMSFASEPRLRMPVAEVLVYVAVACAIIAAAVVYRR